jgi:hypothetical protein
MKGDVYGYNLPYIRIDHLSDPSTAPQKTVSIYYYHKKKFTSVPAA